MCSTSGAEAGQVYGYEAGGAISTWPISNACTPRAIRSPGGLHKDSTATTEFHRHRPTMRRDRDTRQDQDTHPDRDTIRHIRNRAVTSEHFRHYSDAGFAFWDSTKGSSRRLPLRGIRNPVTVSTYSITTVNFSSPGKASGPMASMPCPISTESLLPSFVPRSRRAPADS